ncbi:MAG: glutamine-hydrolyzing GMP synthase [Desulfurella sp.]|uniref:glutamine-hydrolyzing GMP synthase n=1 Tax=Desulfurella sp. TaxID=1962857 RepID=UPI003C709763
MCYRRRKLSLVILDFGSQYTQLIARRIRQMGYYAEILPYNAKPGSNVKGVILSGSPFSVYEKNAPKPDNSIYELNVPILGICYGMQLVAEKFEGKVAWAQKREYGYAKIYIDKQDDLFFNIKNENIVWMSHADRIDKLPEGFETISHTQNSPYAAIRNLDKKIWAIQFHPEVSHTQNGNIILENFVSRICGIKKDWNMSDFLEKAIYDIKQEVKDNKVLCAISGGVDSSVLVVLLNKAIGDNVIPVFINNGLLRQNEEVSVQKAFEKLGIKINYIDASELFLTRLKNVKDPEQKRKIIGHTFIDVFRDFVLKLGDIEYLAQGTLYPDVIESVSVKGPSDVIKSHHNVGGLPKDLKFKLIEPFRFLFKDEVRQLAKQLNLDDSFVNRHPFPGPGLAIRIIGEVTKQKLGILRQADDIIVEEIKKSGFYDKVWQAFGVLLDLKSVGVMGDKRTYDYTIVVRVVESLDGMTANWTYLPYDVLNGISTRIINEVLHVNRVVLDISNKPPATIEWE